MSVVTYTALSTYLQNNWPLTSPTTVQIDWLTLRDQIKTWLGNPKNNNVMVACLCGRPSRKERVSNTGFIVVDPVEVKVYVKNQGSLTANAALRDTVYAAIESLIVANSGAVPGVNITDPVSSNSIETAVLATANAVFNCKYTEGT